MSETNSGSATYTSIGASSLTYPPNGRDHPECDKDVSPFLFMWFFKYFIICIQFHILNIGASPLTGPPTRQDHPESDKDVSPFFVVGNKNLCFDKRPRYRLVWSLAQLWLKDPKIPLQPPRVLQDYLQNDTNCLNDYRAAALWQFSF